MAHGYRLYSGIWDNKPPGLYLIYLAVYHLAGPSLVAIRLVAMGIALALVLLAFLIARHYVSERSSLFAALLTGLLFGVPFLEGTTANAELFLAFFTALGVLLWLCGLPGIAGVAMVAAFAIKSVAIFDLAALGIWLLLYDRPASGRYFAGVLGSLGLFVVLSWGSGILVPMLHAVRYDFGYVGHGNAGLPWILLAKLALLALVTVVLRRAPFTFLWLAYAAAGTLISGRLFGHYALQAMLPLAVTASILVHRRPGLSPRGLAVAPLVFLAGGALSAGIGWGMAATGHDSSLARRLQYYANFARLAVGQESYGAYRNQVDNHVSRNILLARKLRQLPPGKVLIWGNVPWVYVLSNRLPATPYPSAYRDPPVPGERVAFDHAIREQAARVVVVIRPPLPPLGGARVSLDRGYRLAGRVGNGRIYVAKQRHA